MDKVNFGRLVRTLDRLKDCAEAPHPQAKVMLTSTECQDLCEYIWWLTDQIHKAKPEKQEEDGDD